MSDQILPSRQREVPEVSFASDVDGDLYMFADGRYPDRFDWLVTDYDVHGRARESNQVAAPGNTFVGVTRRGDSADACWSVGHQGRIEVQVPGFAGSLVVRTDPKERPTS